MVPMPVWRAMLFVDYGCECSSSRESANIWTCNQLSWNVIRLFLCSYFSFRHFCQFIDPTSALPITQYYHIQIMCVELVEVIHCGVYTFILQHSCGWKSLNRLIYWRFLWQWTAIAHTENKHWILFQWEGNRKLLFWALGLRQIYKNEWNPCLL